MMSHINVFTFNNILMSNLHIITEACKHVVNLLTLVGRCQSWSVIYFDCMEWIMYNLLDIGRLSVDTDERSLQIVFLLSPMLPGTEENVLYVNTCLIN